MKAVRDGFKIPQALEMNVIKRVNELTGGIRPTSATRCWSSSTASASRWRTCRPRHQRFLVALRGDDLDDVAKEPQLPDRGGRASTKKLKEDTQVVARTAGCAGHSYYRGASTGRLAGKLIQPQNSRVASTAPISSDAIQADRPGRPEAPGGTHVQVAYRRGGAGDARLYQGFEAGKSS